MSDKVFIDTNILVYANDKAFPEKQRLSRVKIKEAFDQGRAVISTQVLHEFFTAYTKKLKQSPTEARKQIEDLLDFEIVEVDVSLIREAIDCSILDQISYWDALMIVCALRGGCGILLTEDLNHGQSIKGIKIVNIFK